MYEDFVRNRITELRLKKGVSEYQMSYDLGHSRGYVYNISSGKSLPPLSELFAICDYFGITPSEFFNQDSKHPELIQKALDGLNQLDDADLLMVLGFINRLTKAKKSPYAITAYGHGPLQLLSIYKQAFLIFSTHAAKCLHSESIRSIPIFLAIKTP